MAQQTATDRTVAESFRHYDADIQTLSMDHVAGWVPKQNVAPLVAEVDDASAQYWSEDGHEAFVTTL